MAKAPKCWKHTRVANEFDAAVGLEANRSDEIAQNGQFKTTQGGRMQNPFSADITLYDDPDDGLRIECLEPHVHPIVRALTAAKFTAGTPQVAIQGTANLHPTVELLVTGGKFDDMKMAVYTSLIAAGVTVTEENFSSLGGKHIRFNLENISMFGL